MCHVFSSQPFDFVNFLLDFQALQVVELGLVALKCTVHIVLGSQAVEVILLELRLGRLFALKNDYATALVAGGQQLAVLVKLNCANYIRLKLLLLIKMEPKPAIKSTYLR